MNIHWSIVLVVLSTVQIYLARGQCPNDFNACPYVQCGQGSCISNNTLAACYRCVCNPGYTGNTCDTRITPQSGCSTPCQNGGTCQETSANVFSCRCPSDFTGNQCETSIYASHICVTNPNVCLNGGTCSLNGQDFLCSCAAGWTGKTCDTKDSAPIRTCSPNLCGAHGTCIEAILPNGEQLAVCMCENSYTGKFCETNNGAACPQNYCQNGGSCNMNGNTPTCACPPSYSGTVCEMVISTVSTTPSPVITTPMSVNCASSPCLNGGSCYNTGNSFYCYCKLPYSGPTCNIQGSVTTVNPSTSANVDACLQNPCQNGGKCYRNGNSFFCLCASAYTGNTCDTLKTPTTPASTTPGSTVTCANRPCQNGGTCYNTGNSYYCYCGTNSNFTGKNCETPKGGVSDSSCPLNCSPGNCIPTGNSNNPYACMCQGVLTPTSCSA